MKPYAFGALAAVLILPVLAHAQTFNGDALGTYTSGIISFINVYLIPFIWAIAFIVFIYGVFQYFIAGGANEEQRDKGKQLVMWGIIAFVIMTCLWGIVNLLTNTFNFGGQNAPRPPVFNPGAPNAAPAPTLNPDETFF
ncbi:MAG: hypothetical protein V4644_03030 [Patescibacteria group bacterium]